MADDTTQAQLREYEALFQLNRAADMRAVSAWIAAKPGRSLSLPDRADLVVFLLDLLELAHEGLEPMASEAASVEQFIERRARAANDESAVMRSSQAFRLRHFKSAAKAFPLIDAALRARQTQEGTS